MRWTLAVSLLLCWPTISQGQAPAYAQEKTEHAEQSAHSQDKGTPKWEKLDRGQVLKLWQLEGGNVYPQVSILRVSNATYLEFLQNPKGLVKYVNDNMIFSKAVILAGPWVSLSSVDEKADPTAWVLTLLHGKMSEMIVAALPQLKGDLSGSPP
jgi:hypothetical protein